MTRAEILDKRIATVTRRYNAELENAAIRIKHEQSRISSGKLEEMYETCNLSSLAHLLALNSELGALLALKDQIECQDGKLLIENDW